MARIRTIKPEFPQSESMGRVSRDARLLFVMLWPICDDHGRTRAASRMLASLLFPYDDDAKDLVGGWLDELERESCIRRYEANGSTFLEVCNWLIHQKIDKPSKPQFPEPPRNFSNPREDSSLEGKGREGKGEDQESSGSPSGAPAAAATNPDKPILLANAKADRLAQVTADAVAAFNAILGKPHGQLAAVHLVNEVRQNQVKRCIGVARAICSKTRDAPAIVPEFWKEYFAECQRDPFKNGDGPYSGTHANWRPDFEYLTRKDVMTAAFDRAMSEVA